ncbi:MAG TPA: hypothetical protein VL866_17065, partial [Pyrinomonadaceae bacterium]|nr:hypothetical protein [Pyrinomonadaceae bacterium]
GALSARCVDIGRFAPVLWLNHRLESYIGTPERKLRAALLVAQRVETAPAPIASLTRRSGVEFDQSGPFEL